jgi:hypothetical protein
MNYIGKHWRGELSLGMAFGVNVFLLNIALALIDSLITFNFPTENPITISRYVITSTTVSLLIIYPWQFVGLWRACNRSIANKKNPVGARIIKGLVVFGIFSSISMLSKNWIILKDNFHLGFQLEDEFADYKINLIKNGKLIHLEGGFGFGVSKSVQDKLETASNIEGIVLDSRGGRIYEGRELAKIINKNNLNTYSLKGCYSACAISFVAGKRRFLGSGANIGFHKYEPFGTSGVDMTEEQEKDLSYFRQAGVKKSFLERLYKTSNKDLWYPTVDQLLDGNVIHEVVNTSDLIPLKYPPKVKKIIDELLNNHSAYKTIRKYEPEIHRKLVVKIQNAVEKGASQNELQMIGKNVLSNLATRSMFKAQDDTIVEFVKTLLAMLREANNKDPIICMKMSYPEQYGSVLYSEQLSGKASEKMLKLFNKVLVEGYTGNKISINAESAENIMASVYPHLENKVKYMELKNLQNKNDYRIHCETIIDTYSMIMTNEKKDAANTLRYLFSQL